MKKSRFCPSCRYDVQFHGWFCPDCGVRIIKEKRIKQEYDTFDEELEETDIDATTDTS